MRMGILHAAALMAALRIAASAPGQPTAEPDWVDRAVESLHAAREQWAPEAAGMFEGEIDRDAVRGIVDDVVRRFGEADLEALARLEPGVRSVLAFDAWPAEMEPVILWLRDRADYFPAAVGILRNLQKRARTGARVSRDEIDAFVWRKTVERRPRPKSAAEYETLLKPHFRAEGVPEALFWVAEVESSMRPDAVSPVGAAGLYQFMPATAERFGLRLRPEDERFDPEKSARAAARYLRFLHRQFDSWPLALAAYNCGEGRVAKTRRRTGATTFGDLSAHLPSETQLYVPKVLAVIEQREGQPLR
jgi:hypothetical protein